ncbi:MAG: HNH endonuclease signature motif containing protein [Patescibacteria group bacterium]|nr:HNH endonuclease signature motif containing protein [Patescibacteria group bacterium]
MQKRKSSTRQKFLKKRGLKKTPIGKEIDHKIPLADGGSDSPKNLRLIKKSVHKKKTVIEARKRAKKKK